MTKTDEEQWESVVEPFPQEVVFSTDGAAYVGKYVRTQTIDIPDEKAPGGVRPTKLHVFTNDAGEEQSIWGSHNLDKGMEKVPEGAMTRVQFVRSVEIGGGRSVKEYSVQFRK